MGLGVSSAPFMLKSSLIRCASRGSITTKKPACTTTAISYFDPSVGRFIGQDPVGENVYSFGRNALAWVDPLAYCHGSIL